MPEISSVFYSLLGCALELRPEGLAHLVSGNSGGLANLGNLIRHGLFQATSSQVSINCLEVVTYLCEFALDAWFDRANASTAVLADRIVKGVPLDGNLLQELLSLTIRPAFVVEMEETLAIAIMSLAYLNAVRVTSYWLLLTRKCLHIFHIIIITKSNINGCCACKTPCPENTNMHHYISVRLYFFLNLRFENQHIFIDFFPSH